MEENFKGKFGFILFIFIILFLAIGGFFFTKYVLSEKKEEVKEEVTDYKIDKNKDYIYYTDNETISEEAELEYMNVIINLKGQETLTNSLKEENERYKNNVKYISDQTELPSEIINYNNDNIYALTYRTYENYEFDKYVSLVIKDYNYSCFDLLTFTSTKSYVFDTTTGKLLEESDILNKYNTTIDKIKEQMKEYLNSKQTKVEDVDLIKIDETINELNNYSLYINEYGRLYISFLVKSNKEDYNDSMEVR